MLTTILGFSAFGLAARLGQLGMQKRSLISSALRRSRSRLCVWIQFHVDPAGHAVALAVGGAFGYWEYQWEQRADVLIAAKRQQISERRQAESIAKGALAEAQWGVLLLSLSFRRMLNIDFTACFGCYHVYRFD